MFRTAVECEAMRKKNGRSGFGRIICLVREEISQTSTEHGAFLKLIVLGKYARGFFYTALGVGLIALVGRDIGGLLRSLFEWVRISETSPYVALVARAHMIKPHMVIVASILALFYGVSGFLQAIGLHHRRRWAEYVTALAAAALIPGEVYLLAKGPTVYKAFLLLSNFFVVGYLIYVKGLFISVFRSGKSQAS